MSRENYQLTGQKMQGYKISKPIGQGKFSIVYRAQNDQGLPFALKKIKIFDMADQKQREKCLKEVDLMKPLNHPNIIRYIDSFIHNNELIIVTEWAEKGDLKKLIKEREADQLPFDEATIWEYIRQISSALRHMHEKRIMHRDLKPANIFISNDNTLKIGDLGLGRSFSSETLQAYSKVGTPLYMSPELIQDSGYTQNADVWSLGCICYQLAQLKSPFRNQGEKMSLMDLFENITRCNYKPISSNYSSQLKDIVKNMIVVDPSKRWSSEQVLNETNKYLDSVKKPLLDPLIAMDDIYIKLSLLNYESQFCKHAERKPVNKLYFAIQDGKDQQHDQLYYFLQLAYWIMALSKPDRKKDKLPIYTKTLIDWRSPGEACHKFLQDLSGFGIKFEEIGVESIRNGYGQAVCYLLNQVLNRQLIRTNFQFKKPIEGKDEALKDDFQDMGTEKDIHDEEKDLSEQSLEEQSQFQQSMLFNKNIRNRKENCALIDKIEQLQDEQDKMIIHGRTDEREWRAECLRLEKKFSEIAIGAKEARKKSGYINIETSKICSAKLTDLIKYVQPIATVLFNVIDRDLQKIKKGQALLNAQFSSQSSAYSQINQCRMDLSNKQVILSKYIQQHQANIQKIDGQLAEFAEKINMISSENQNSKVGALKAAITLLRKELNIMEQKKEILSWELRKHLLGQRNKANDDYLDGNYFEED